MEQLKNLLTVLNDLEMFKDPIELFKNAVREDRTDVVQGFLDLGLDIKSCELNDTHPILICLDRYQQKEDMFKLLIKHMGDNINDMSCLLMQKLQELDNFDMKYKLYGYLVEEGFNFLKKCYDDLSLLDLASSQFMEDNMNNFRLFQLMFDRMNKEQFEDWYKNCKSLYHVPKCYLEYKEKFEKMDKDQEKETEKEKEIQG